MDIDAVKGPCPAQQPLRQRDIHHNHACERLFAPILPSKQAQHGEGLDLVVDS